MNSGHAISYYGKGSGDVIFLIARRRSLYVLRALGEKSLEYIPFVAGNEAITWTSAPHMRYARLRCPFKDIIYCFCVHLSVLSRRERDVALAEPMDDPACRLAGLPTDRRVLRRLCLRCHLQAVGPLGEGGQSMGCLDTLRIPCASSSESY